LIWLTLGNLIFCALVAVRQKNLNLMLANSSLAHMGFAFLGLASVNVIGLTGTVLVMVAHALLAGLSFALTGFLYARTGGLEMGRFGGLLQRLPFIGAMMIAAFMAGCGLPGFANFAGELTVLFGAWKATGTNLHPAVIAAAWGGLILGAVYMLRAIRQVLHGDLAPEFAQLAEFPTAESLPSGEVEGHEANTAGTLLTWVLHSALGGTLWSYWRRFPYVMLLAVLLIFGFAPNVLTTRIEPAVASVIKLASARTAVVAPTATASVNHP
jgi:NADH-quinone oxidoreductase subunit M